ncbi:MULTISPECIES: RNA polymerase sigma factor [unclassified Nocardiopsis]|uniref:RNA polymerase sigma factor n=1 Tax=unclassified Nocardiopsis TaxID=2649073 RepID=UPI001359A7AC|nr:MULTISPECIES: sigma-70 family RNA polymerase sigma factor [unclassified Nocardiopsis]
MTRGTEGDETTAVEALYDAFASSLYRYAWSLLGDEGDPAAEAVHDGLVAGVLLDTRRADPADRGPWLYALVRAACQRRGLAQVSPYTRLATVPAEKPVARMFAHLPASHRELVELNLRHALPTSAVARVLGLDPQICGELSRSAVRRAAENLEGERAPTGWRDQVDHVSSALALLRPPGPPPDLRDRVVRTCLDPEFAAARERIVAHTHPLTSDGYPVHRSRAADAPEEAAPADEPGPEAPPRALPRDRLTTRDHPVREEAVAELAGPGTGPADSDDPARSPRRRWPLPAVSGLATVALAVALWAWASAAGGPPTVIGIGPEVPGRDPLVTQSEAAATASDTKLEATDSARALPSEPPPGPGEPSGAAPAPEDDHSSAEEERAGEPAPPAGEKSPPSFEGLPGDGVEFPGEGAVEEEPTAAPSEEDESGDGGSGGLFHGLLGLLFGGG